MWRVLALISYLGTSRGARTSGDDRFYGNDQMAGLHYYYKESEPVKEQLFKELGCYCKKVASVSDCPDWKIGKRSSQPEQQRYFHPEVMPGNSKPHFCCKLAWTAWYNRVGFFYKRQADFQLCTHDVRPVPEDKCCYTGIGEDAVKVGVRLSQIESQAYQRVEPYLSWKSTSFGKSYPYFTLSSVTGGTDFDGSVRGAEEVRQFLKKKLDAGLIGIWTDGPEPETFLCQKTYSELMEDTGECRLRSKNPSECCCLEDTVQEAERCLPVPSGAASTLGPMVVTGVYTDSKLHGLLRGKIGWPKSPEELDKELPPLVKSKDPNVTAALDFEWSPAGSQWRAKCVKNQTAKYITGEEKTKRYRCGTRTVRMGKMTSHRSKYCNKKYMVYYQEEKQVCISYEYTRVCPQNHGLYVKQFPEGTCAKVPGPSNKDKLQLQDIGSLTFQCPDGYKSGTEGGLKFDAHCKCAESCH